MDREYADNQIGDLDSVENDDQIGQNALLDAVDEFIEDKKMWFRELHKDFGEANSDDDVVVAKNSTMLRQVEIEDGEILEEVEKEINRKILNIGEQFAVKADEEFYNAVGADIDDDEKKWACETIWSTYTSTDNHPGVIKTQRRIRPKQKIEFHK